MNSEPDLTNSAAGLLPIRAVASQTSPSAATLRAGEHRCGLLQPQQTFKGYRLYAVEHLARTWQMGPADAH